MADSDNKPGRKSPVALKQTASPALESINFNCLAEINPVGDVHRVDGATELTALLIGTQ